MQATELAFQSHQFLQENTSFLNFCHHSNLLTASEISQIHKKRLKFEQQVMGSVLEHRRSAYLRYLAFEMNLLNLLEMRTKQVAFSSKHQRETKSDAFKNYCSHIVSIFRRACVNHPRDEVLWKSALDFCIKYDVKVRQIMDRALKMAPHSEALWLLCAKWYSEFTGQIKIARNLLQRAIHACPASESLWTNFFRMECYLALPSADEIVEALQDEDEDEQSSQHDTTTQHNTQNSPASDEEEDNSHSGNEASPPKNKRDPLVMEDDSDEESSDDESEMSLQDNTQTLNQLEKQGAAPTEHIEQVTEQEGERSRVHLINSPDELYAVPLAIMEEVCQNSLFKDNVSIRFAFLDVLKQFPRTEKIQQRLLQNIISNFSDNETALFRCITFRYNPSFSSEELTQFLDEITDLISVVQTEKMWELMMEWCLSIVQSVSTESESDEDNKQANHAEHVLKFLLNTLLQESNNQQLITPHMTTRVSNLLHESANTDKALKLTSECIKTKRFSSHVPLLISHLRNLCHLQKHKKARSFLKKMTKSSRNEQVLQSEQFWDAVVHYISTYGKDSESIEAIYKKALISVPNHHNVRRSYLQWAYLDNGVEGGKKARTFILSLHPAPLSTYFLILDMIQQMEGANSKSMDEVYESALLDHGKSSAALWVRYIAHLKSCNRVSMLSMIRQRALSTVDNVMEFEELERQESLRDL